MAAKLIAEDGALQGMEFTLEANEQGQEWIMGRDPEACQLLIENPVAEEKQLKFGTTEDGIILENLSESTPLLVNDIELIEPQVLTNGDQVKFGEAIFRFQIELPEQKEEQQMDDQEPHAVHDEVFDEEIAEQNEESFTKVTFDLLDQEGRWLMKVIAGPNSGAEYGMETGKSYLIGTEASCDIIFHDISVSRQHARITVGQDNTLEVEDLSSRNGSRIDGEAIEGKKQVESNTLVTMGTTTFLVIDQEGERKTIVSPPLMTIGQVKKEEEKKEDDKKKKDVKRAAEKRAPSKEETMVTSLGALMLLAIVTGLFVIIGLGTTMLFQSDELQLEQVDVSRGIEKALAEFPDIKYSYNSATGRLLLLGHVLTPTERNQIRYNLQSVPSITNIDDNIVIDEYVWQEINQQIGNNSSWKGISIHAPQPGRFLMTGYLATRSQADQLFDYVNRNFAYLDLLERRVVVEEDILSQVNGRLQQGGFRNVAVIMENGELVLSGTVPKELTQELQDIAQEFEAIQGVRVVRVAVNEVAPTQAMVNLSDRYEVTGSSFQGETNLNVVINGKILTKGDQLDGMTITGIEDSTIFLEKDGFQYKIDFNQ